MQFQAFGNQWLKYLKRSPLFEVSILCLLYTCIYVRVYPALIGLIPLVILSFPRRLFYVYLPLLIVFGAYLKLYQGPLPHESPGEGEVCFKVSSATRQKGFFGSYWAYQGTVLRFKAPGQSYKNLPCVCYLKEKGRMICGAEYEVRGILKIKQGYGYQLKITPSSTLKMTKGASSLVEYKEQLKLKYKKKIHSFFLKEETAQFFIGLTTGEFSNPFLSFTFLRFGLNHLLAISGFHFGLLVLFLTFLFYPLNSRTLKISGLILSVGFFSYFLGFSPSVFRAWVMVCSYFIAMLFKRPVTPLNVLSLAFLLSLIKEPLIVKHLGFQYSFLITYSILVYYPLLKNLQVFKSSHFWLAKLKAACCLALCVNLVALPLTLYYAHKFYLLSLLANLIVPPFVGVLLFIFGFLLLISYLPFLNIIWSWRILEKVTFVFLEGIGSISTYWDFSLRVSSFSLTILWMYGIIFVLIPVFKENLKEIIEMGRVLRSIKFFVTNKFKPSLKI